MAVFMCERCEKKIVFCANRFVSSLKIRGYDRRCEKP